MEQLELELPELHHLNRPGCTSNRTTVGAQLTESK